MSRIGRLPVTVPTGVDVTISGRQVTVKGPKGQLSMELAEPIVQRRRLGREVKHFLKEVRSFFAPHVDPPVPLVQLIAGQPPYGFG